MALAIFCVGDDNGGVGGMEWVLADSAYCTGRRIGAVKWEEWEEIRGEGRSQG